jgi:hypothetical protein
LVLRLASLLWRLRRATTMETGLFEIQADHLSGVKQARQICPASREFVHPLFGRADAGRLDHDSVSPGFTNSTEDVPDSVREFVEPAISPNVAFARCFLRLANLPNYALDRLSRYEAILWRQVRQIMFTLDALDRRKPQDRKRHFRFGNRQGLSPYEPEEY